MPADPQSPAVEQAKRRAAESMCLAATHRDASRCWREKARTEQDPELRRVWLALSTQQSDIAFVCEDAAETFADIAGDSHAD